MATGISVTYDKPSLEHTGRYPQVGARIKYVPIMERNEIHTELRMDYYEILLHHLKQLVGDISTIVPTNDPEWNKTVTLECLGPFIHDQINIHNGGATGTKDPLYTVAITSMIITYLDADITLVLGDPAEGYDATGTTLGRNSSTYASESSSCYTTDKCKGIDLLPGSST
ncbi:hypothetical protein NVP1031O_144 [Vibrio phage 1.031.O._10N.261.46.F8]|nr:hypothetical protein NVP1031O_144 [Vibrio phage 1.031.O._10N.261.46.F8]